MGFSATRHTFNMSNSRFSPAEFSKVKGSIGRGSQVYLLQCDILSFGRFSLGAYCLLLIETSYSLLFYSTKARGPEGFEVHETLASNARSRRFAMKSSPCYAARA